MIDQVGCHVDASEPRKYQWLIAWNSHPCLLSIPILLQSCCRQIPIATWAAKSSSTQKCFHGSTILPRSASLIQNSWLLLRSSQVRFRLEFWGLRSPYVNQVVAWYMILGHEIMLWELWGPGWRLIRTMKWHKRIVWELTPSSLM